MRFGIILAGFLAISTPAFSQSIGLLIGNEDYSALPDVRQGDRIFNSGDNLERAGVQMISRRDANRGDMFWALSEFGQRVSNAETVIVALSGRFIHSATETYFMPVDAQAGPLSTLASRSLPLSTVMAWLAAHPGEALLMLSTDTAKNSYGPHLMDGLGEIDIPQGVTVIVGGPRDLTRFMADTLTRPGRPFVGAARQEGLSVFGYAPNTHILLHAPAPRAPTSANDRRADILGWRIASGENTVEAYQQYLEDHPNGEFARMAENRIKALTDTPEARAERAEQALDLSRNARRSIQRNLSLLGFNTRGIDGIFGRGTRAAIAAWQTEQRVAATGFLSREQIETLNSQAEARARELEEEAEQRRQAQLAADIDYWDQTGASGSEEGLRLYLQKFPDGEFAEVAQQRLAQIEGQKRNNASRKDRSFWDKTRQIDTIQAYENYLQQRPNGAFREDALARLDELEREQANSSQLLAAQRAEQSLNLSPRTRQIVEARLNGLGLKPGRVDGVFDDDTRRAIRRYQGARDMEETGYLSEAVVVQLLADTVRQIFR